MEAHCVVMNEQFIAALYQAGVVADDDRQVLVLFAADHLTRVACRSIDACLTTIAIQVEVTINRAALLFVMAGDQDVT